MPASRPLSLTSIAQTGAISGAGDPAARIAPSKSVVIATRNRASALPPCLESITASVHAAGSPASEIIVVDNGSSDRTPAVLDAYARQSFLPVRALSEPPIDKARALNRALVVAQGEILAFTDDDCRFHRDYVADLLRRAGDDAGLVIRGGRIELGDPTDLPFTIDTRPDVIRWSLEQNPARHQNIAGQIAGCNMTAPRALIEQLGPFDGYQRRWPALVLTAQHQVSDGRSGTLHPCGAAVGERF